MSVQRGALLLAIGSFTLACADGKGMESIPLDDSSVDDSADDSGSPDSAEPDDSTEPDDSGGDTGGPASNLGDCIVQDVPTDFEITDDPAIAGSDVRVLGVEAHSQTGVPFEARGDLTGDGLNDLVILDVAGATFVVAGPITNHTTVASSVATLCTAEEGPDPDEVRVLGDLDADGYQDLMRISAGEFHELDDPKLIPDGAVYLLEGPLEGVLQSDEVPRLFGDLGWDAYVWFGDAVGDLEGDGLDGVVVSRNMEEEEWDIEGGAVYYVNGPAGDATWLSERADAMLVGDAGDSSWKSVAGGGDLDGDGLNDVVIGGIGLDAYAAVCVYTDLAEGSGTIEDRASGCVVSNTQPIFTSAILADRTGDGLNDVVTGYGTVRHDGAYTGGVFLMAGPVGVMASIEDATAAIYGDDLDDYGSFGDEIESVDEDSLLLSGDNEAYRFDGPLSGVYTPGDAAERWHAGAGEYVGIGPGGDLNGDGVADNIISSPGANIDGLTWVGEVDIIFN